MKRTLIIAIFACAMVGCSSGKARVKGKLLENGNPTTFGQTQAAMEITPIDPDGTPVIIKMFTAVVNEDGSFEVVASGGELPPGFYDFSFRGFGKIAAKYKDFAPVRRELKPGANDITIDLARPE